MGEYRIDDLARAAGMTTRNVRAYQDRGLLPPPRRSGRVALYDDAHLARLRLIGSMLSRGYAIAHIDEMLGAWEAGRDLADVLGLEETLTGSWRDDLPVTMSTTEVREQAGDPAALARLESLGLVSIRGSKTLVRRPQLLSAFVEMRQFGMPTATVLDLYERLQPSIDDISRTLVAAAVEHIGTLKGPRWLPTSDELGELTTMLARFRQLSTTSVQQSIAASMEAAVESAVTAFVAQLGETPDRAKNAG